MASFYHDCRNTTPHYANTDPSDPPQRPVQNVVCVNYSPLQTTSRCIITDSTAKYLTLKKRNLRNKNPKNNYPKEQIRTIRSCGSHLHDGARSIIKLLAKPATTAQPTFPILVDIFTTPYIRVEIHRQSGSVGSHTFRQIRFSSDFCQ